MNTSVSKRAVVLDYDAGELDIVATTEKWMHEGLHFSHSEYEIDEESGSVIVLVGDTMRVQNAVEQNAEAVPSHLLSVVLPQDGEGPLISLRGPAYASAMERKTSAKGRTAKLAALPSELNTYWERMNNASWARED